MFQNILKRITIYIISQIYKIIIQTNSETQTKILKIYKIKKILMFNFYIIMHNLNFCIIQYISISKIFIFVQIMVDNYLEQGWNYYKSLFDTMSTSTKKVLITCQITQQLQKIFVAFSDNLEGLMQKLRNEVSKESAKENQKLLNLYNFFRNSILKISDFSRKISVQIKNEVVDPFLMFIENYRQTNKTVAKKFNDMLTDIDRLKKNLNRCQNLYYQNTQKKINFQKDIQHIKYDGNFQELQKANIVYFELQDAIKENQSDYKFNVEKINSRWKQVIRQIEGLVSLFQYNQQARTSFSKSSIMNIIRIFGMSNQIIDPNIQQKAYQSDENFKAIMKISLSQSTRKGKLLKFLRKQKKEQFMTLQEFKKRKQSRNEVKDMEITQKQKLDIDLLINKWFFNQQPTVANKQIKILIIESPNHSFYFLDNLIDNVHKISQYFCKIQEDYFYEILNIFILISNHFEMNNSNKCIDYLYKMINVSMKIIKIKKNKKNNKRQFLCSYFGRTNKVFYKQRLWLSIYQYLKNKNPKKIENSSEISKLGSFLFKGIGNLVGIKQVKQQPNYFKQIQQLCTLFSNLSISTQFSLTFLKKLLVDQQSTFQLIKQSLYSREQNQLRKKYIENKLDRLKKQKKLQQLSQKQMISMYCIRLIAKKGFFSKQDVKLRLLCSYFKNAHKYILLSLNISHKWIRMIDFKPINYIEMKQVVAQNSIPSSIQQIISLDVNRSLHMHLKYIPPTLLHTILRTFAFYNKNISYCQGMNYIAGYLFIKTREQQQTYILFERLMQDKFSQLFSNQLQVLTIKMYQFQKLLSIHLPDLADHLKQQKITTECYMVSWILTLFSSTYDNTYNSYIVDTLWNRFMVKGWKQFFKFTLWIFNIFKEELLELNFDVALKFFGDLIKNQLFTSSKQQLINKKFNIENMIEELDSYHITNNQLQKFRKQYELLPKPKKKQLK